MFFKVRKSRVLRWCHARQFFLATSCNTSSLENNPTAGHTTTTICLQFYRSLKYLFHPICWAEITINHSRIFLAVYHLHFTLTGHIKEKSYFLILNPITSKFPSERNRTDVCFLLANLLEVGLRKDSDWLEKVLTNPCNCVWYQSYI